MTAATPGSAELLTSLLPFIRAGDVNKGEPSFWFAEGAQEVIARLAAKPDEEGVREARAEGIAITLCLVDGHNPDDEAPLIEMCDGDNMSVPWWMVYTEYAESLLAKYHITERALSTTGAPKP